MPPSFQTRLKGLVDRYTPDSLYTAYGLNIEEHIGTFDVPVDRAAVKLYKAEYGSLPTVFGILLSAAKRHPETGKLHDVTRRKVPQSQAEKARTAELTCDTELADYDHERLQYHAHLFDTPEGTDVFSHLELRSDPYPVAGETWSEAIGRLMIHYSPTYDQTLLEGASEPKLEQLL